MESKKKYYTILGAYEIIGGITGLFLTIWMIGITHLQATSQYLLAGLAISLYAYSIFCGLQVLKNKNLKYSRVNQILQLLSFSINGFGVQYISGFFITIGFNLANQNILLKTGFSTWQFTYNFTAEDSIIQINLVAIFLLIFIDKLMKMQKVDELMIGE